MRSSRFYGGLMALAFSFVLLDVSLYLPEHLSALQTYLIGVAVASACFGAKSLFGSDGKGNQRHE